MTPGLTSVIIPSFNHAAYLPAAIESALAQTARVEVIVVDDGSTDETGEVLERYAARLKVHRLPHDGPSAARNRGIDSAAGEFVMFLDADDVLEPMKLKRQLEAFTDDVGFVLCDVRIEDELKGRTVLASAQYGYAGMGLGGWILRLLQERPFIPIMSPLVRASVLEGIRFDDRFVPEDYHFWLAVAARARCRYIPEVLATYRHRKTGRSRAPKGARHAVAPNIVRPLRLNLGCGRQGTRSWHPMEGMVNLDKSMGWTFESGLGDFTDRSVAGVTISHALMYLAEESWPAFFSEVARVLEPGGVIRITEDDTANAASRTYGVGWRGSEPAVVLTGVAMAKAALERAGLEAHEVDAETSRYADSSLLQAQHGAPPDVFFIEGVKVKGVLFSPHADDEALFASFTLLRYRPAVIICCPSSGDYGDTEVRLAESRDAGSILGAESVSQWQGGDLVAQMRAYDAQVRPTRVWAPDRAASHPDHVAVAQAAVEVFGSRVSTFHTYDAAGKVRSGTPVEFEPEWVGAKLRALARYESQIRHPRANVFFRQDLAEYLGEPSP